jgi:hypothetical protein
VLAAWGTWLYLALFAILAWALVRIPLQRAG